MSPGAPDPSPRPLTTSTRCRPPGPRGPVGSKLGLPPSPSLALTAAPIRLLPTSQAPVSGEVAEFPQKHMTPRPGLEFQQSRGACQKKQGKVAGEQLGGLGACAQVMGAGLAS